MIFQNLDLCTLDLVVNFKDVRGTIIDVGAIPVKLFQIYFLVRRRIYVIRVSAVDFTSFQRAK